MDIMNYHKDMNISDEKWENYIKKTSHLWRRYAASEKQQRAMCEIISGLPAGSVVLELGVCHGLTAGLFLLACRESKSEYWGIDNFSLESKQDVVSVNLDKLGVPYKLINSRTQDYPWLKPIDFLFIDAGHDEVNVRADCEKYIPFVKSGSYVSLHDYLGCADSRLNSAHWAVTKYGDIATMGWRDIAFLENQMIIRQKP